MGSDIVLNVIKVTLGAVICVLLLMFVAQRDRLEGRMRDIDVHLDELRREIESKSFSGGGPRETANEDPRTKAYWPTEDNMLSDPSNEPAPPPDAPRGGTINFFFVSNPRSLNGYVLNEAQLRDYAERNVYEYVGKRSMNNPDLFVPGLANRVTVSDDKKIITIYLRKGRYWHKPFLSPEEKSGQLQWLGRLPPQEVTAEDVKFTIDTVRSKYSETPLKTYVVEVDRVEIVDKYTCKVYWKKAGYFNLPNSIFMLLVYPKFIFGADRSGNELPEEEAQQLFAQHWFNQKMCGSGPFRFEGFTQNQHIRLRRYPNYKGIQPAVDEVVLHIVGDADVRLQKFKAGDIDIVSAEPHQFRSEYLNGGPGSLKEMVDKGEISMRYWESFSYYYIGWNFRRAIFRDQKLRRALAHAFPRKRIIRDVYYDLAVPHNSHVHRLVSTYDKSLPRIEFDLKRAAALLEEAGWKPNERGVREKVLDGKRTELRFSILIHNLRPVYRDFCLLYQKELKKIGVIMELQVRDWQKMLTLLNDRDFDACSLGWASTWDSDPSQIWAGWAAELPKSSNHISYKNPELDEVIHGIETEFDGKKRKELWHRFQQIIAADDPYLFLHIPRRAWFVRNRLGNQYFSVIRPNQWLIPWFVKK